LATANCENKHYFERLYTFTQRMGEFPVLWFLLLLVMLQKGIMGMQHADKCITHSKLYDIL
jgi:hypothetical protein